MRRTDEAREAYARERADGRRAADREISRADAARKHEVEAAFTRGKETAAADITIEITPFEELHEGFWSSSATIGYKKQLLVRGLPVGEASLVIVAQRTKLERERVKEVLALLRPAMEEAAKALATQSVRALMK
jgi:hypothetical protein